MACAKRCLITICLVTAVAFSAAAQEESSLFHAADGTVAEIPRSGVLPVVRVLAGGKAAASTAPAAVPAENVIVELDGAPLVSGGGFQGAAAPALRTRAISISESHRRLRSDIAAIESRLASSSAFKGAPLRRSTVKREYSRLLNAVALQAAPAVQAELRKLSYVKGLHPDVRVRADLAESVPLVRAPELWKGGATGRGMTVAVVDTGVDYRHPDLGGGLGAGRKVRGGYDFVNNDADPLDDHGHGTHVAGIIAATGTVCGVAPGAQILACKVLDASGSGFSSDIIAGMEYACDPDGDPATDDGADVINMSLGGDGDANDPMSHAVENAVAAGVVCVVAAGNNGAWRSIDSPGCSPAALTVGAADNSGTIASFSSRGPAGLDEIIKPDLLAPGVSVYSTLPGSTWGRKSGTSMATPMVAGLCALLRQLHPSWDPAAVKSALMQSARDLGYDACTQGAGAADGAAAAAADTTISPASLSFGRDDPRQSVFTKIISLRLSNAGAAAKTYTLGTGSLPAGVSIAASPSSLSLAPGASGSVSVTLTVDNAVYAGPSTEPFACDGALTVTGGTETLRLPFSFVRSSNLQISFDRSPAAVLVHDRSLWARWYYDPGTSLSVSVPDGSYDVAAQYYDGDSVSFVLREGVVPGESVWMPATDAVYRVTLAPKDAAGADPGIGDTIEYFVHRPSLNGFIIFSHGLTARSFSAAPSSYTWDWAARTPLSQAELCQYAAHLDGVSASRSLGNTPQELRQVTYTYAVDASVDALLTKHCMQLSLVPEAYAISTEYLASPAPLRAPFSERLWYASLTTPAACPVGVTKKVFAAGSAGFNDPSTRLLYETARLSIDTATAARTWLPGDFAAPFAASADGRLPSGLSPACWLGRFANTASAARLVSPGVYENWLFYSQTGDHFPNTPVACTLTQNGVRGITRALSGVGLALPLETAVTPGPCQLELSFAPRSLSSSTVTAVFDTTRDDKDPPYFTSFRVLDSGSPAESFAAGSVPEVRFSVADDRAVGEAHLAWRRYASTEPWTAVPLSVENGEYVGRLSLPQDVRLVSLLASCADAAGNTLTFESSSAFGTGISCALSAATGGSFAGDGGVRVTVSSGTLDEAASITVTVPDPLSETIRAADLRLAGDHSLQLVPSQDLTREIRCFGLLSGREYKSFSRDISITLPYADADQDGRVDGTSIGEKELRMYYLDETNGRWTRVNASVVDPAANTVTVNVNHLSTFRLMAGVAGAGYGNVIVYPNPFTPSRGPATIAGIPAGGTVTVAIYTVAGELVRTLRDGSGIVPLTASKNAVWDGTNDAGNPVASGIYLYVVRDPGVRKTGKIAVVR